MIKMNPKFMCDENGREVGVVLKAKAFERLIDKLEDYHDYMAVVESYKERKKNPRLYTLDEMKEGLEKRKAKLKK